MAETLHDPSKDQLTDPATDRETERATEAGIRSQPLHHEIADSLIREILQGRYQPGDRLPSERDLAARFDANRGSVREAVKKLEQIGLVEVQPGGGRIMPLQESSLDVVGYLFAMNERPDPALVHQVLTVMSSLMQLAVESAVGQASDEDIVELRAIVAELLEPGIDQEARFAARMALGHKFMRSSNNLPLMLIARSLRIQFVEHLVGFNRQFNIRKAPHREKLMELDRALIERDTSTASRCMREIFEADKATLMNFLRTDTATPPQNLSEPEA